MKIVHSGYFFLPKLTTRFGHKHKPTRKLRLTFTPCESSCPKLYHCLHLVAVGVAQGWPCAGWTYLSIFALEELQVEACREMKQVNRKTSYWFSSDSSSPRSQAIKGLARVLSQHFLLKEVFSTSKRRKLVCWEAKTKALSF